MIAFWFLDHFESVVSYIDFNSIRILQVGTLVKKKTKIVKCVCQQLQTKLRITFILKRIILLFGLYSLDRSQMPTRKWLGARHNYRIVSQPQRALITRTRFPSGREMRSLTHSHGNDARKSPGDNESVTAPIYINLINSGTGQWPFTDLVSIGFESE